MLSSATIIGRSHRLIQQNCHDFAITGSPAPGVAFGLALDGCGSKYRENGRVTPSRNETGANLLGTFAAQWLNEQLTINNEQSTVNMERLLQGLFESSLGFLGKLVAAVPFADEAARREFIATRLLCTLVGFVRLPGTAVFFWLGDGYLCRDGRVTPLESDNRPDYLAYRLLGTSENDGFHLAFVPQPAACQWLAVATDGWHAGNLSQLADPMSSLALQRHVNVLARQHSVFEDDGGVAVWWNNQQSTTNSQQLTIDH